MLFLGICLKTNKNTFVLVLRRNQKSGSARSLILTRRGRPPSRSSKLSNYPKFGRHPRLGIEPDKCIVIGRLNLAYQVASCEAKKQEKRHKKYYDLRVREANYRSKIEFLFGTLANEVRPLGKGGLNR